MNIENKNPSHPLLYILVILVALNLAATSALLFNGGDNTSLNEKNVSSLPDYLTNEEIEKLKNRVIDLYNKRDVDTFYDEFDGSFHVQITRDEFRQIAERLYQMAGRIEDAAYVGFTDQSKQGQPDSYVLNFMIRVGESDFSTGSMTITIFDRSDYFGITGFFMNPKFMAGGN